MVLFEFDVLKIIIAKYFYRGVVYFTREMLNKKSTLRASWAI